MHRRNTLIGADLLSHDQRGIRRRYRVTAHEQHLVPQVLDHLPAVGDDGVGHQRPPLKDHAQIVGEGGGFAPEMYVWSAPSDVAPSLRNPAGSQFVQPMHWGKDFYARSSGSMCETA